MSETPADGNIQDGDVLKKRQCRERPEHMKVLFDCTRESFYKRGLPLAGILGVSTYGAIKAGYLKPAKRLGVFPKVSLAVILGIVIGRVSYRNICIERMKQVPGGADFDMRNCFKRPFDRSPPSSDTALIDKVEDKTS